MEQPAERAGAVLVSGASGLIGTALRASAAARGVPVRVLVRRPPAGPAEFRWDPEAGLLPPAALAGCDAVIHLAGEKVAGGRWTAARRARLRASRVRGTRLLAKAVAAARADPKPMLVCASATGYYGDRGDDLLGEDAGPGSGFLPELCAAWEDAAAPAAAAGARVVHLRFGVVLARGGGALPRMLPAFRWGLGGRLGSGRQWLPWLALADAVRMIEFALATPALAGPVNAVAGAVRNLDFARALGRALGRPARLPVPAPFLRLALGALASELLLASQRVVPRRLASCGFAPRHPALDEALAAALRRP